jgi:hypothetical protein
MVEESTTESIEQMDQSSCTTLVNATSYTPIPVIQAIGINLCGVPAEELSPKKLLAELQEEEDKL